MNTMFTMCSTREVTWSCPNCGLKIVTGYPDDGYPLLRYLTPWNTKGLEQPVKIVPKDQVKLAVFGGEV